MSDGDEKKTILGYVSAYLKRPLRSLSEVEEEATVDPLVSARTASHPYERRATGKNGTASRETRLRREDTNQ